MRLSTVFISAAFVLASMSAALPVERGDMLVARFADPDFPTEVEARAYDEELELYARGTVPSKSAGGRNEDDWNPIYRTTSREPLLGSPPDQPKNDRGVPRKSLFGYRPNTDSRPHPRQRYIAKNNGWHKGSPGFSP
ncbi:hypothetical protein M378DRAFT_11266 [Amanita muscaria Koide BX008]|uniref:Uncharacterized protein n=1 Tax=Amanita muscaria (strain Koide BX008) TaxID=946122 RepID=A0A0C2SN84_AMAMK|nr:hypothetical protein M378DRAFT_11266 [Amanita muscaria Koide BX008]